MLMMHGGARRGGRATAAASIVYDGFLHGRQWDQKEDGGGEGWGLGLAAWGSSGHADKASARSGKGTVQKLLTLADVASEC